MQAEPNFHLSADKSPRLQQASTALQSTSFMEKEIERQMLSILLLQLEYGPEETGYAYIALPMQDVSRFLAEHQGKPINLERCEAEVIARGKGEPSAEVKQRILEDYGFFT